MADTTPTNPALEPLAERGLENYVFSSAIWARASGGPVWSYPRLHCAGSTVPRRAFNQAIITSTDVSDDDLRDAIKRFEDGGLRYRFRVRSVLDDAMRPRLEALGLVHRGGIPAMVFRGKMPGPRPNELTIEPVATEAQLAEHTAVVVSGFDWEATELARVFQPGILREPGWHAWVGYDNGEPVATSQMVVHNGTGGLYYVAVLDTHRRKGYGEAITRVAVDTALANGCDLATLNASPDGYPIYKRLGFQDVGLHIGYTQPEEDD